MLLVSASRPYYYNMLSKKSLLHNVCLAMYVSGSR